MEAIYVKISRDKSTGTVLAKEVFHHVKRIIDKNWTGLKTELVVLPNDFIDKNDLSNVNIL